jgi:hypothetical protein
MSTRNKVAAALSAAAVGVGGVAAHASVFADDAVRRLPRVPVPHVPPASDDLARTAEESEASKDVVCAAIGFLDVVEDPTLEGFFEWASDEVNQTSRGKAERIFEAAQEAYEEGDLTALSDIPCEF